MHPITMRLTTPDLSDTSFTTMNGDSYPAEIFEEVSELLAPYGLRIALDDADAERYRFKVEKVEAAA